MAVCSISPPSRRAIRVTGMINLGVPKAAMNQFARYIALELAPHGITANLVAPATVQGTSMNQKLTPEQLQCARCGRADGTTRHARRGGQDAGILGE